VSRARGEDLNEILLFIMILATVTSLLMTGGREQGTRSYPAFTGQGGQTALYEGV
jgi:hypothetical protein